MKPTAALLTIVCVLWGFGMGYTAGGQAREAEIFQACDKAGNFVVVRLGAAHLYSCKKVSP